MRIEGELSTVAVDETKFGGLLKQYRKDAGLTQMELAKRLAGGYGLTPRKERELIKDRLTYVRDLESGRRRPPSFEYLRLITEQLHLGENHADVLFVTSNYPPLSAVINAEQTLVATRCYGLGQTYLQIPSEELEECFPPA